MNKKAFALIFSIIVAAILVIIGAAAISRSISESRMARRQLESAQAFWTAEAGIQRAILNLNNDDWTGWTNVDGDMVLNAFVGSKEYNVILTGLGSSSPTITSTGIVLSGKRTVRVELNPFVPAPENAISIFGGVSKYAKIKIHQYDNQKILVSGYDNGNCGPDRLAIGVEDANTLAEIIDSFKKKDKDYLEDIFVGDPKNIYTDKNDNSFSASIGEMNAGGVSAELMEEVAQQLANNIRLRKPTKIYDLKGVNKNEALLDPDGDGVAILGGSASDVIYLTNGNLKLDNNLNITGIGTLVVDGARLDFHKVTFDWDGDIYILGDEEKNKGNDTHLKFHHAQADITGDIFLLGSDNGKAKLKFYNTGAKNDGYTKIVGSIMGFGGTGNKSKAELKVHHGNLDIEGFISLTGTKVKLDLHQHSHKDGDGNINITGGIALLMPDTGEEKEDKDKLEIQLHAAGGSGGITINYDSCIVQKAITRLRDKLDLPLKITTWREL